MKEIQSSNIPLAVILSMLAGTFIVFGGLMLFANAKLVWFNVNDSWTMAHVHVHVSSLANGRYGNHIRFSRWIGHVCVVQDVQRTKKQVMGFHDSRGVSCKPFRHRRFWARRYTWIGRWHNGTWSQDSRSLIFIRLFFSFISSKVLCCSTVY